MKIRKTNLLMQGSTFKQLLIVLIILADLFPAILLFLMLILPFKRYDLMEGQGISKTRKEKNYLLLSYLLMVAMAILPRILESK